MAVPLVRIYRRYRHDLDQSTLADSRCAAEVNRDLNCKASTNRDPALRPYFWPTPIRNEPSRSPKMGEVTSTIPGPQSVYFQFANAKILNEIDSALCIIINLNLKSLPLRILRKRGPSISSAVTVPVFGGPVAFAPSIQAGGTGQTTINGVSDHIRVPHCGPKLFSGSLLCRDWCA